MQLGSRAGPSSMDEQVVHGLRVGRRIEYLAISISFL